MPIADEPDVVLDATNLDQDVPRGAGRVRPHPGQRRRRREPRRAARGVARHRRRVRLREDHARAHARRAGAPRLGHDHRRGARRRVDAARGAAGAQPGHPDGLPGPLHLAQPAPDGLRPRLGAPRGASDRAHRGGPARAGGRAAGPGQPLARHDEPLPPPVLRRAAAAHRHRPGDRAGARRAGVRRARVGARRVGAGAGHQPAALAPAPAAASGSSSSPTTSGSCATSPTAPR